MYKCIMYSLKKINLLHVIFYIDIIENLSFCIKTERFYKKLSIFIKSCDDYD